MDIEFAEFEAMDGLSRDFPADKGYELPIGQLMIEIHLFKGRMDSKKYLDWWERLEVRGLRPAWTEPNLIAVTMNANGDKDPNMAEYTMINVQDKRNRAGDFTWSCYNKIWFPAETGRLIAGLCIVRQARSKYFRCRSLEGRYGLKIGTQMTDFTSCTPPQR
jgi:hypothetical protein